MGLAAASVVAASQPNLSLCRSHFPHSLLNTLHPTLHLRVCFTETWPATHLPFYHSWADRISKIPISFLLIVKSNSPGKDSSGGIQHWGGWNMAVCEYEFTNKWICELVFVNTNSQTKSQMILEIGNRLSKWGHTKNRWFGRRNSI